MIQQKTYNTFYFTWWTDEWTDEISYLNLPKFFTEINLPGNNFCENEYKKMDVKINSIYSAFEK